VEDIKKVMGEIPNIEMSEAAVKLLKKFFDAVNKKIPGLVDTATGMIDDKIYKNQFGGEVQLSEEDIR
jgi:hypothetical protein